MSLILGLGGAYRHDSSACLVRDGTIVAFAEEERFRRVKHNAGSRSCSLSAAWCLAQAGVRLRDVDAVVIAWTPERPDDPALIRSLLDPAYFGGDLPARLETVEHHRAHAASAFYCSGFDDAAVLVVDGFGDGISTSICHGTSRGITFRRRYPYGQSLGWFYEAVTMHAGLGDFTSAGKLMGLAAYGEPRYELGMLRVSESDYEIDLSFDGFYPEYLRACSAALTAEAGPAQRVDRVHDLATGSTAGPPGYTRVQADLAASVQHKLERALVALARAALAETGATRLCVAGGVGLNCSANGVLWRESGAADLFIQPAAGDAGCAIGAALEHARRVGDRPAVRTRMTGAGLGPAYDDDAIRATLDAYGIAYSDHGDDITGSIAKHLAAGDTVGWFQGGMEGGPRALGHRSILADPRSTASRDHINRAVKRREMWRPLAPSMLATAAPRYLDGPVGPADFMIVAYRATDVARAEIPATVHVDGSLRPQLVDPELEPRYARLLGDFAAETGVAALLNTSFNHEAEPIVCSPTDALRTFFSGPLDALALGSHLITKSGRS